MGFRKGLSVNFRLNLGHRKRGVSGQSRWSLYWKRWAFGCGRRGFLRTEKETSGLWNKSEMVRVVGFLPKIFWSCQATGFWKTSWLLSGHFGGSKQLRDSIQIAQTNGGENGHRCFQYGWSKKRNCTKKRHFSKGTTWKLEKRRDEKKNINYTILYTVIKLVNLKPHPANCYPV